MPSPSFGAISPLTTGSMRRTAGIWLAGAVQHGLSAGSLLSRSHAALALADALRSVIARTLIRDRSRRPT